MIHDIVPNISLYRGLDARLVRGLEMLHSFETGAPIGRREIEGEALFALVQTYETTPSAQKRFEAHRRYADIQYVVSGEERILHAPTARLTVVEAYDPEKEVMFLSDPPRATEIVLTAGAFAIFWPGDAHKPGCALSGPAPVLKVVIKVLL